MSSPPATRRLRREPVRPRVAPGPLLTPAFVALVAAGCGGAGPGADRGGMRLDEETMGTRWMVRVRPGGEGADGQLGREMDGDAPQAVVDRAMSNWREDSEVSRLNARGGAVDAPGPTRISQMLAEVAGVGRGVRPHRRAASALLRSRPGRRPFGVRANSCSGRRGAGADGERPTAPDARTGVGEAAPRPGRRGAAYRREHAERRNGMAGRSYHSLGARRGWPDSPGTGALDDPCRTPRLP